MRKPLYFLTLLIILSFLSVFSFTRSVSASTGFLGGPMWINPENPTQGDLVTLSALFHNAENSQLTGEVSFYDGDVLLGKKIIVIPPGGVSTATVSFRIGAGSHTFAASTGSMQIMSSSGTYQVFAMAPESVQLPQIFVSPNAGSDLTASVVNNSTQDPQTSVILNQVNNAQNQILSSVPDSIKNPVQNTLTSIDGVRAQGSSNLDQSVKSAQDSVDQINSIIANQQKKFGKANPTDLYINRPFAYVKLFFVNLAAFLFKHTIIFYLAGLLILFFVIRLITRKILHKK